jgi:glycerol-1-phosphate dehydrogenase [NAD(P)+]
MTLRNSPFSESELLAAALKSARDTRLLILERAARHRTAEAFAALFGSATAIVIADEQTFGVAGRDVVDSLRAAGQSQFDPLILPAAGLYAEYSFVDQIRDHLKNVDAIPIAIGAGSVNDLVKLAAHQCERRPYLAVATAASMDGYTAYGASITYRGSKQTFDCPAPKGVVADLDILAAAPPVMNASGYADLIAKIPAGADWILADFLGEEPISQFPWDAVQSRLRDWMQTPGGVRSGDFETIRRLSIALMMTGFAMQSALSSRPASGAEHQFSHLWDMEGHKHNGQAPSHGFKVGIGSLASIALYEALGRQSIESLDVDAAVDRWPDAMDNDAEIAALFAHDELKQKAFEESRVKLVSRDAVRTQLEKLKAGWPELSRRLAAQLEPHAEFRDMLREAGAPYVSESIGIDRDRLRRSYRQAYHIRRRFTILDVVRRAGLMELALDDVFSSTN